MFAEIDCLVKVEIAFELAIQTAAGSGVAARRQTAALPKG